VLFKLDFAKAYDKVSWVFFLFKAMKKLGMPNEFFNLINFLIQKAKVPICFNGNITSSFKIHKGVKQGCPLAPYLFFIV